MSSSFRQLLALWYQTSLNSAAGFVIAGVGDLLCQRYFEHPHNKTANREFSSKALPELTGLLSETFPKKDKTTRNSEEFAFEGVSSNNENEFHWDSGRSLDMALIRAVIISPFVTQWYPFLARTYPGSSLRRVVGRVAIDQAIASPYVICMVFAANSYLHGNFYGTIDRIKEQFFSTWAAGLRYWPIVHMITFGVIPPPYQTLFAHFASVYWNAVLSFYANKSSLEPFDDKRKDEKKASSSDRID